MSLAENTGYKITKRVIILTLILSGIMLILVPNPKEYVLGLIIGAIINLLNFRLMSITLVKSIGMPKNKIMPYVITNYMLRYLIYGVVLAISVLADYLNFVTVAIGFFMVKIVILLDTFYGMIKRNK